MPELNRELERALALLAGDEGAGHRYQHLLIATYQLQDRVFAANPEIMKRYFGSLDAEEPQIAVAHLRLIDPHGSVPLCQQWLAWQGERSRGRGVEADQPVSTQPTCGSAAASA